MITISQSLKDDITTLDQEVKNLTTNLHHIREIVALQQNYAGTTKITEKVFLFQDEFHLSLGQHPYIVGMGTQRPTEKQLEATERVNQFIDEFIKEKQYQKDKTFSLEKVLVSYIKIHHHFI